MKILARFLVFPALLLPVAHGAQAGGKRYDHGDPTAYEQLMLEMINRARANPAAEAERQGTGLNDGLKSGRISKGAKPPLAFNPALIAAARAHTRWMLETGHFSHAGLRGSSAGKRMTAAGYVFSGSWSQAENISYGGSSGGTPDLTAATAARHRELFRSPQHRKNICGEDSREIGLGILGGRFQGSNAVLATQDFARSGAYPDPLVTGVVFEDRNGNGFYDPGEGLAGVTVTPADTGREAVTSASGGYAVPYSGDTGTLTVTFSGGPLRQSAQRSVKRTGENVKVDLSPPRRGGS